MFQLSFLDWKDYKEEVLYNKLVGWYDGFYYCEEEEKGKGTAHDFASYILNKVCAQESPQMEVRRKYQGGYCLAGMTEENLCALLTMIKGASLQERRTFDGVKRQIEKILNI